YRPGKIGLPRVAANFSAGPAGHRLTAGYATAAEDRQQGIDTKGESADLAARRRPLPLPIRCSMARRGGTKQAGDGTNRRIHETKAEAIGTESVSNGTRVEWVIADFLLGRAGPTAAVPGMAASPSMTSGSGLPSSEV